MTVDGCRRMGEDVRDDFPVGMRILAVDDDPVCLKLLENMLSKCQYHVTGTNQARVALKMLRGNKDKFDLVISDVHMPDMDGFKLLELVGLEMDLPVIMLSANGDTRLVMKGVTHGACDYLVKPVRIEELRNIWQHVMRRKRFDSKKTQSNSSSGDHRCGSDESGLVGDQSSASVVDHHNGKLNHKRRKDEEEGKSDDGEEDEEDPSAQKRARVVWHPELHRKFIAAVNKLGIEKAVPKKILDLMNVEGLTRENVASHLQKFRIYLKKNSLIETSYGNIPAVFGGKDSAYNIRMGSPDGFRDLHTLAAPGQFSHANTFLSSSSSPYSFSRPNTSAGVSLQNLNSLGLLQPSHAQTPGNLKLGCLGKLNSNSQSSISSFLGIPSLELDQVQHSKFTNPLGNSTLLTATGGTCTGSGSSMGNSINTMSLQKNSQYGQKREGFGNPNSLWSDPLNKGPSNFLDHGEGPNDTLQNPALVSILQSNQPYLSAEVFGPSSQLCENNDGWSYSTADPHLQGNPLLGYSSAASASMLSEEGTGGQTPNHEVLIGKQIPSLLWEEHKKNHSSTNGLSSSSSGDDVMPFNISQGVDQNYDVFNKRMDTSSIGQGQPNGGSSAHLQDSRVRSNEDYLLNSARTLLNYGSQGSESFGDLMDAIMKQDQNGDVLYGEFGLRFDECSYGS